MERQTIRMACPHCGYAYFVALFHLYEAELCPLCGHQDSFINFQSKGVMLCTQLPAKSNGQKVGP
jgi:rubredoxin